MLNIPILDPRPWTPLSWLNQGLACWYSPLFAPSGTNVTEVTAAAGSGTITQSANTVTGSSSQFVKEVKVGDVITATGISGTVTAIASATSLTLDTSATQAVGQAYTITPVAGLSARVNRVFDQSGLGRHVDQATRSKMGALGASAYAGKPGFSMDGADDLFVNATAFLTGSAGAVFSTWILPSGAIPDASQTLLSSGDEGTAALYRVMLSNYVANATPNIRILQRNNDTADNLTGNTTILAATRYITVIASDSSAYIVRVNSVAQTLTPITGSNNGDWFADTTLLDNVTLGALKVSTEQQWFRGTLLDLCVLDGVVPTLAQYQQYEAWAASVWP